MLDPDGQLVINLSALRENYRILKDKVGGDCRVAAVLKADGYSLGADHVAKALRKEGCRDFLVAKPAEAIALRKDIADAQIYVLNGFYQNYAQDYIDHNLIPVIGSFMEVEEYTALSQECGKKLPAYLKFNTRMNRLGFGSVAQEKLWNNKDILDGINIIGVMSHMACADEDGHPLNDIQLQLFQQIAQEFPKTEKSFANSSAVFRGIPHHYDMVRAGAALYGVNPTPETKNPMKNVVSLKVPIIRTRHVFKNAKVGYGADYTFERDTQIATIAAGYADGLMRALSNRGTLYWRGYPCPIRGRISMDLTTVDLCNVPENERPKPGDMIEILGDYQGADALGHDAGTIGYEILTNLGRRYKRTYSV